MGHEIWKNAVLFEGSRVPPACRSDDSSSKVKMNTVLCWNDTDRGHTK
jgi:hypothetical protein